MTWVLAGLLAVLATVVASAALLVAAVVAQVPWLAGGTIAPASVVISAPVPGPAPAVPVPTLMLDAGSSALIERTIAAAMTWLSPLVPYRWGGCSRAGVDCSCFIDNILLAGAGIRAPRVTTDQIHWALPIAPSAMRRGDLIFFHDTCTDCGANPTHVAMYLGGGQFIHAGDPVQISSISSPLFTGHFQAVGRPPGF